MLNNNTSLIHFVDDNENGLLGKKKTMMVFVVGGITYLEIAALRFLSNNPSYPYNIIIGTTSVGSTLLKSLVHSGL